jgi:hypothetical protein
VSLGDIIEIWPTIQREIIEAILKDLQKDLDI